MEMIRRQDHWLTGQEALFDTVNRIAVPAGQEAALREAFALCRRCHDLFSRTRPGSDVWRINRGDGWTETAPETAALVAEALALCRATEGVFDLSVAPAVALWDFKAAVPTLPDGERLAQAARRIDYRALDTRPGAVYAPAGVELDLGGIAKGWIADRVTALLRARGVAAALLDLGGSVSAFGAREDGQSWRIGLQDPRAPRGVCFARLAVRDCAVVTSSAAERGFQLGGRRWHHILDPHTGLPAGSDLLSATVLTPRATDADALATACFALGRRGALALAERLGFRVILMDRAGEIAERR